MAESMTEAKAVKPAPEVKGAETAKTIKYKVVTKCWWNKTLWRVDQVVELASTLTPPKEYFQKI